MKVLSISLLNTVNKKAVFMGHVAHLAGFGFFKRTGVSEMLTFTARMLAEQINSGQRSVVEHHEYICYCTTRVTGISGVMICDYEYPARVAFRVLTKVIGEFLQVYSGEWYDQTMDNSLSFPQLSKILLLSQDPRAVDKVSLIQNELESTKEILHQTIESVLERGVKLDELVQRSNDISQHSKIFYKGAKRTNSCCSIG